ncbi:MAG: exosortase X [Crocinitomicaceae bacterium]
MGINIKRSYIFVGVGIALYLIWLVLYQYVIKVKTDWDFWLNYNIVDISNFILNSVGFSSYIDIESDHVKLIKDAGYNAGVWVGDNCNGFKLFSIFSIFLIAFPGSTRSKFWYIPLGIIVIHLANVVRIIALFIISDYHPEWLDFNHLYTFTAFVYGVIFILWLVWIKKYGTKLNNEA